ncbi:MAG: hypothetical protein ACR2NN_00940 [Bryobacteraceae bacterium]
MRDRDQDSHVSKDIRSGPQPLLTGISNSLQTGESYSFRIATGAPLVPPAGMSSASYGGTALLQSMTQTTTNLATGFTYDGSLQSGTSGELTQVTLPYGGTRGWQYQLFGHAVQSLREVQTRTLNTAARGASGTTYNYSIAHDPGDPARYAHASGILTDSAGNGQKVWYFQADGTQFNAGLQVGFDNKQLNTNQIITHEDYTWAQDGAGRPYLASTVTTQDGVAQKKSTQAMDNYGNVTQTQLYDWGNLATAVRTYTNLYSASYTNYTPLYIFNRLIQSQVQAAGGPLITLVNNFYDTNSPADVPGINRHDPNYGTAFGLRGNLWGTRTLAGSSGQNLDIGGNPTSVTVNGVTTTPTINANTNWAAPSAMTTNSLTSTMNWTSFLAPSSQTGPNGDTASITYDPSARPQTSSSPFGAVTNYVYSDTASPPTKIATTNGRWVRTTSDGFGRTIKTSNSSGTPVDFAGQIARDRLT